MSTYTITLRVKRADGSESVSVSNHHANLIPLEAIGRAVRKNHGRGAYFRLGRQDPTAGNVLQGAIARDKPLRRDAPGTCTSRIGTIQTVIEAHATATVDHFRKVRA